jgi:hypothetical protein
MTRRKADRVREQVVVYLDRTDRELLEEMAERTGLARTELFRRGLRRLAEETIGAESEPGSSLPYLIGAIKDGPRDLSARPDYYLYGGGYEKWERERRRRKKR